MLAKQALDQLNSVPQLPGCLSYFEAVKYYFKIHLRVGWWCSSVVAHVLNIIHKVPCSRPQHCPYTHMYEMASQVIQKMFMLAVHGHRGSLTSQMPVDNF